MSAKLTSSQTHVVYGECAYLRRHKISSYIKQYHTHTLTRVTVVDDFATLCHQSDLFATKTLYLITATDEMRDLWQYLSEHGASNVLLFDYQRKALPKKLIELCKKANASIDHCPEPKPYAYRTLVASMCREKDLQLDATGQQTLLRACGNNLDFLHNETDKLALLFGNQPISSNDIAPHLGILREDVIFLLTDLLQQRKYNQAQVALEKFICRGEQAVPLLGLIAYSLRNRLRSNDRNPSPYRQQYTHAQSASPAHIMRLLKECQQADASIKTSATAAKLAVFDVVEALRSATTKT